MLPLVLFLIGHQLPVERTVMLEPSGARRLQVLVHLKVPSGNQRATVMATSDLNHDGRLDRAEKALLERALLARAFDGLKLLVGTATVTLDKPESKLAVGQLSQDPTELMVHGTVKLPKGEVDVTLTTGSYGDPLFLEVLPGSRAVAASTKGTVRAQALSTELALHDRISIHFTAAAK